jgi:hypothetical protein
MTWMMGEQDVAVEYGAIYFRILPATVCGENVKRGMQSEICLALYA